MDNLLRQNKALIVALDKNLGIGYKGGLPWKLKGDLKRFKALTLGGVLIMGRKTFESLPGKLEGRHLIVVSKDPAFVSNVHEPDQMVYGSNSLQEAAEKAAWLIALKKTATKNIWYIGGASIFEEALAIVDRAYITFVVGDHTTDVKLKKFDMPRTEWCKVDESVESLDDDETLKYPLVAAPTHYYSVYERVKD